MRVNIIGKAPGWQDAPIDGVCWGFNDHILKRPFSVMFDMHDIGNHERVVGKNGWKLGKLNRSESNAKCAETETPIFSLGYVDGLPVIEYPLSDICKHFDTDYFSCGVAYAMAMAIYQKMTEIDIWGVFLSFGGEHAYQKPCIEYWIGRAIGLGIKVTVHGMTTLLKNSGNKLYGYNYKQVVAE